MPDSHAASSLLTTQIKQALDAFQQPAFICHGGLLWMNSTLATTIDVENPAKLEALVPRNLHTILNDATPRFMELVLQFNNHHLSLDTQLVPYQLNNVSMQLGLIDLNVEETDKTDQSQPKRITIKTANDDAGIEKEKSEITLQSISEGIIVLDTHGYIDYLNSTAELMTGVDKVDAIERKLNEVLFLKDAVSGEQITPILENFKSKLNQNSNSPNLLLRHALSGYETSVDITCSPIISEEDEDLGSVIVIHDISDLYHMSQQMIYQASHDSLTGLINRGEFEKRLLNTLQTTQGTEAQHVICYIDLDQFKVVNDTCGHLAGDELLRQISQHLKSHTKTRDVLGRLGGDEFGLVLMDCDLDHARLVCERIRQTVMEHRFEWNNKIFQIGASIGGMMINKYSGTIDDVMSAVDSACYLAKESGRNRVNFITEDDTVVQQRKSETLWVQQIQQALADDRFQLYAQPIVSLNNDLTNVAGNTLDPQTTQTETRFQHQELLLRLIDDDNEAIEPRLFMNAAQRYHLMPEIDRWVISNALARLSDSEDPLNHSNYLYNSINISSQSVNDESFIEFVMDAINNSAVEPSTICFEIMESTVTTNISRATAFMNALKPTGIRFALDNFCSSLSSFSYIKNLPLDYLKIDGKFMQNMIEDEVDSALISAIRDITNILGVNTIAGMVEDEYTYNALKTLGIDYAQGYFISPPIGLLQQYEEGLPTSLNIH